MAHQHSRRDFIKKLSGTVAALSLTTEIASAATPSVYILKSGISSSATQYSIGYR